MLAFRSIWNTYCSTNVWERWVAERLLNTHEDESTGEAAKFRTTPIASTITRVKQLPSSAILYKCAASQFWQFRVFLEGSQRKRSTRKTDIKEAEREAKLIYADMLQTIHGSEQGKRKLSSKRTLSAVAASLWEKQDVMISQGELNKQKNKNEKYVFERHIRPFFKDTELKDINADTLEQFKLYLARQKLAKSTQKGYFNVVAKLLQEAVKKQYIHSVPILPRVRMDDEPRGYFNSGEYTRLWNKAQKLKGKTIAVYKDADYDGDTLKPDAKPYRKITITNECYELIMFMRNTYVRPTDIKVIKHKHIIPVEKGGITFLELRHPATKRHSRVMTSTEYGPEHYNRILEARNEQGYASPDDYVFMPQYTNRDYALKELTRQFDVVMREAGLKTDVNGKKRTLYSLRHTAIVAGIHSGISEQTLAINARTSVDMIDRFYGSHIKSVLDRGTEIIDRIIEKREHYKKLE
jgi:hypothetical protein